MIPPVSAPPVLERSFTMTANLSLPGADVTGPVFAVGSSMGGMGLYLDRGRPLFLANSAMGESRRIEGAQSLPAGASDLTLSVVRGATRADGGADLAVTISAAGKILAQQTTNLEIPTHLDLAETFAIGRDDAAPILPDYPAGRPFGGEIGEVMFDFNK